MGSESGSGSSLGAEPAVSANTNTDADTHATVQLGCDLVEVVVPETRIGGAEAAGSVVRLASEPEPEPELMNGDQGQDIVSSPYALWAYVAAHCRDDAYVTSPLAGPRTGVLLDAKTRGDSSRQ